VSDFEITDGNITGIPVLDKLYPKNPIGVMTEMALIGSLTIALTGYGIDEYNLFKKYTNEMYPNLEIKYTDAVKAQTGKFIPSKKLYFYRVDASEAPADITTRDYYYFTATNGSQYLSNIVAAQDFSAPTKMSSNEYDYTFAGVWTDWNTKLDYY
jgi:hypothetical protein